MRPCVKYGPTKVMEKYFTAYFGAQQEYVREAADYVMRVLLNYQMDSCRGRLHKQGRLKLLTRRYNELWEEAMNNQEEVCYNVFRDIRGKKMEEEAAMDARMEFFTNAHESKKKILNEIIRHIGEYTVYCRNCGENVEIDPDGNI